MGTRVEFVFLTWYSAFGAFFYRHIFSFESLELYCICSIFLFFGHRYHHIICQSKIQPIESQILCLCPHFFLKALYKQVFLVYKMSCIYYKTLGVAMNIAPLGLYALGRSCRLILKYLSPSRGFKNSPSIFITQNGGCSNSVTLTNERQSCSLRTF